MSFITETAEQRRERRKRANARLLHLDTTTAMTICEARERRKALGLTQADMARAIGVIPRTMRAWESAEALARNEAAPRCYALALLALEDASRP